MPEEITDEPSAQWRCTGHVVRVERADPKGGKVGVGVQFDCYEVSRAELLQTGSVSYRLDACSGDGG
jgi:hypothetical protein